MLRPGSRISSASGVRLIQPSYAQSTPTIAAIIPGSNEPPNLAGQTGLRLRAACPAEHERQERSA